MPDPLNRGSCVLWLSANDATTIHATGGLVDQWDDKSGLVNHQVTATGASRPTTGARTVNSKNSILFNGANVMQTVLAFNVALNFTVCVAALNDDGADSTTQQLVRDVTNGRACGKFNTNNWYSYLGGNAATFGSVNNQLHRFVFLMESGAASIINVDGVESAALNAGSAGFQGGMRVGSLWNGPICEVVVYSTAMSVSERAAMITYFQPWTPGGGGVPRTMAGKFATVASSKAAVTTVAQSKLLQTKVPISANAKQGNVLRFR